MATMPMASPIIASVAIQDNHLLVFRGSTVTFGIEVRNNGVWQPQKLVDLTETPTVTLFNPLNEVIVDSQEMARLTVGRYAFQYKTKHTDEVGLWTARFGLVYGDTVHVQDNIGIFLLREATFATFTYLPITDPEGSVWFIWIDQASQMNVTKTLPDILRVGVPLTSEAVAWQRVNSASGDHRWVDITVTGQLMVEFFEPITTPGTNEDLVYVATDGRMYYLFVMLSEQLVPIPLV